MDDVFRAAERMMAMDDATWARHANPWSGVTRFSVLPLLVLAIWSRVWLGWWCLVAVGLVLVWNWANTRVFPPPSAFDHWMSRAVLGERIFLEHRAELPGHQRRAAHVLAWASLPGLGLAVWGLWALWWEGAVFGTVLAIVPKVWFCDRMVWIQYDWVRSGRAVPGRA
ncbi:MAG: DUF6653 family protein [Pseudomonadota bacterium]